MLIEWITIITVLLIVGILLHGWRQMRNQQGKIKMSLSMEKGSTRKDLEAYGSDLPSGGARVVSTRDDAEIDQFNQDVSESRSTRSHKTKSSAKKITENMKIPEQVSLNLDESVPMLMDIDEKNTQIEAAADTVTEPKGSEYMVELGGCLDADSANLDADISHDEYLKITPSINIEQSIDVDEELGNDFIDDADAETKGRKATVLNSLVDNGRVTSKTSTEKIKVVEPSVEMEVAEPSIEIKVAEPEEVIVINVMAKKDTRFNGQHLMDVLLDCDLRFGEMNIFHRHEQPEGEGVIMFSMVNMIKPGTFSLGNMQTLETSGVSLFMTLPMNSDPIQAFNAMAETAHQLQKTLDADLKDEDRCAMTLQTLEHYRQRICDFQRKQRLSQQPTL